MQKLVFINDIVMDLLCICNKFVFQYVTTDEFLESPLWYRFFYMFPIFTIFRLRLYFAWIMSEAVCMNAALGAYPASSKPRCGYGPTDLAALDQV